MIADVILGKNIDTPMWVNYLIDEKVDHIIVLDYDYYGDPIYKDNIIFFSIFDFKEYIKQFDSANYYKSMYAYPGTNGKMSTYLNKK